MSTADRPQVVYLWGDDEWTMERAIASLAGELDRDTGAPPDRWRVDGKDTTADAITERVAVAPMFGGGTLAVVTGPMPLVRTKAQREALERALAGVAPGNALVFLEFDTTGGRKRAKSLTDLADTILKAGGTVRACRAPGAREMSGWIAARAADLGVRLDGEAADELARRVGSQVNEADVDRRLMSAMAVGELRKLSLYRGDAPVTAEDVRALVAEVASDSIWGLLDAVSLRRADAVGPALDRLLESEPEQVLLVLLHRRVRELLIAADARALGLPPPEVVKLVGGSPYAAQRRVEQARLWTVAELDAALEGLLELDRLAKHADAGMRTDGQRRMAWAAWVVERVGAHQAPGQGGARSRL